MSKDFYFSTTDNNEKRTRMLNYLMSFVSDMIYEAVRFTNNRISRKDIVIEEGTNGFTIDSIKLDNNSSIKLENDTVYKIL